MKKASSVSKRPARARPPPPDRPRNIVADDPSDRTGRLKRVGGSKSDTWNGILANQVVRSLGALLDDEGERDQLTRAAVAGLLGIEPKDEMEGMLAAQMIAVHSAAMECYRRGMTTYALVERQESLNQANKLSRTYALLLEALDHHRGKAQQRVTVEHVHVHQGGQAIVGNVAPPGAIEKTLEQSKPGRDEKPSTSTTQEMLPAARRKIEEQSRRPRGQRERA